MFQCQAMASSSSSPRSSQDCGVRPMVCMGEFTSLGWRASSPLSDDPTAEQIRGALQCWGMPARAYPQKHREVPNYTLTSRKVAGSSCIHVFLWAQAFVTYPLHEKLPYFSFWASPEFGVGPVMNPLPVLMDFHHSIKGLQSLQCSSCLLVKPKI